MRFNRRVEVRYPTWRECHGGRKTRAKVQRCERKSFKCHGVKVK